MGKRQQPKFALVEVAKLETAYVVVCTEYWDDEAKKMVKVSNKAAVESAQREAKHGPGHLQYQHEIISTWRMPKADIKAKMVKLDKKAE